jgi:unsaturated rhamnogalacturonyl hydrolase
MKTKIRIYLILAFLSVFSKGNSQNIENFLRPYADKIVENTAFEFRDKKTNQKFRSTKELPIKENLEIESEYLHWSYTSALAYDGLFELGNAIDEKSYVNFTKDALFENEIKKNTAYKNDNAVLQTLFCFDIFIVT